MTEWEIAVKLNNCQSSGSFYLWYLPQHFIHRMSIRVISEILPKSLALVEWLPKSLIIQISRYLDTNILTRLSDASLNSWNITPSAIASGNLSRMYKPGICYEILRSDDNIKLLLDSKALNTKLKTNLHFISQKTNMLNNVIYKFVDEYGDIWIGLELNRIENDALNKISSPISHSLQIPPWEFVIIKNNTTVKLILVGETYSIIDSWRTLPSSWNRLCEIFDLHNPTNWLNVIQMLDLENEAKKNIINLIMQPAPEIKIHLLPWKKESYYHSIFDFYSFLNLSEQRSEILKIINCSEDFILKRYQFIDKLTLNMVEKNLQDIKTQAISLAKNRMLGQRFPKEEILRIANKFNINLRYKLPKYALVEQLMSTQDAQKIAEFIMQID